MLCSLLLPRGYGKVSPPAMFSALLDHERDYLAHRLVDESTTLARHPCPTLGQPPGAKSSSPVFISYRLVKVKLHEELHSNDAPVP